MTRIALKHGISPCRRPICVAFPEFSSSTSTRSAVISVINSAVPPRLPASSVPGLPVISSRGTAPSIYHTILRSENTMDLHNFRIVVVGGGPAGLIAAHILSQAGFNFVILEQYHSVTPEAGNALGLWPQSMRVMDQLGLFDALQALSTPLSSRICLTQQGQVFSRSKAFYNPKPK